MKRQQIVMIFSGSLMAIVCVAAGWFLFSAMSAKHSSADSRNQAYEELRTIYDAKVFPNNENIARIKGDEKALADWLNTASNLVHKGDLSVDKETPPSFKQLLQKTVRSLSEHPGIVKGKVVAAGFNFGFDKYLGESDSLPDQKNVDRLTLQLRIIESVCEELYAANILTLESVARETFEEQSEGDEKKSQENTSRRHRRRDDTATPAPNKASLAQAEHQSGGSLFSQQRFSFVFKARAEAFADVLNRLAAMNLFVVVSEVEFHKTDDPLTKQREDSKKKKEKESVTVALGSTETADSTAPLSRAERIVTDPELEPPVSVKIDIDVFSFEGV